MEGGNHGACCACGKVASFAAQTQLPEGTDVRNAIMLELTAPVLETGWGCVVCHLPLDDAMAVECNLCLAEKRPVRWAIKGKAWSGERVEVVSLRKE